jgi:hypothetical protein
MMRVHQAVAIGAAVALNIIALSVLGTSAAAVAGSENATPATVAAGPAEMGYNGLSPDEMGYN